MSYIDRSQRKVTIQISMLMLVFLVASSVANALHERYIFVWLYIISFAVTALNLYFFSQKNQDPKMAHNVVMILFVLFFSFYFIGEQSTFDILWVLILPVVTLIITDYQQTRLWLGAFIILMVVAIILQAIMPELIAYEAFAMWSMLWAGIFFSGMVLNYKKVQMQLQQEISSYQDGLEQKVEKSLDEIDTLRLKNKEMDMHLMQSRLGSLETQLNPHFLFNALNSIAELTHQDVNQAEEAILKVSKFLRNTMSEKTVVSLDEEMRNVYAYVELENMRFADRIQVHLVDKLPVWKVPKFSIQLLVENAIKHGFDARKKHLAVTIDFDYDAKAIMVQNSGKAMKKVAFGIGLSNLDQRLALLCDGKLTVTHNDPPQFRIQLGACREDIDR